MITKLAQIVERTGARKRQAEQSQSCVIEYLGRLQIDDLAVIKTALPSYGRATSKLKTKIKGKQPIIIIVIVE